MTATDGEARLPALDGLRAVAVAAVIVHHFGGRFYDLSTDRFEVFAHPGSHGVRLFFVLSGFLITGILVSARARAERSGQSSWMVWRAFAIRRALRIFPLAYVAMAVAWVMAAPAMRLHPWLYLGYVSNFGSVFVDETRDLQHFWSLAVEEHFYLTWPALLLFARRDAWVPIMLALLVGVFMMRVVTAAVWGPWAAYVMTWSRLDALVIGGLVAITQPRLSRLTCIAAVLLLAGASVPRHSPAWIGLNESALITTSAVAVLAAARGVAARVLSLPPLTYLGTISYGIYVWQAFVPAFLVALGLELPEQRGLMFTLMVGTGSVIAASLSWFILEAPLNRLKRRFPYVRARNAEVPVSPRSAMRVAISGE